MGVALTAPGTDGAVATSVCRVCGQERRHYAHGMCQACYRRQRWPGAWPRHLDACLRCGAPAGSAAYRSHGLCKACSRRVTVRELRHWAAVFRRLRAAGTGLAAIVLDVVRDIGCTAIAEHLAVKAEDVRRWALGLSTVPEDLRVAVLELWHETRRIA